MKSLILVVVLLLSSMKISAQIYIEAGASLSKFASGKDRDIEPMVGLKAGIGGRIYFNKRLSTDLNATYHTTGTLINHDPSYDRRNWRDQFRMELHRVEASALLNLHITKALALQGGWYISYLRDMKTRKWNYDNVVTYFDENLFHRVDYGPSFGISIDMYGAILKINGNIGIPPIGYPNQPLGDWYGTDLSGVSGHHKAFKTQSLSATIVVPIHISKYRK